MLLIGVIAAFSVASFLERVGSIELFDNDYRQIVVKVPCVDTAINIVVKDSFRVIDSIRWVPRDSVRIWDSIKYILLPIFDSASYDLPLPYLPLDSTSKIHVTADSLIIENVGKIDYAILSGGPVFNFSHRFTGQYPSEYKLTPSQWQLGAAIGLGQFGEEYNTIYQINGGWKSIDLYLQSDLNVNHAVLIGYTKLF